MNDIPKALRPIVHAILLEMANPYTTSITLSKIEEEQKWHVLTIYDPRISPTDVRYAKKKVKNLLDYGIPIFQSG